MCQTYTNALYPTSKLAAPNTDTIIQSLIHVDSEF